MGKEAVEPRRCAVTISVSLPVGTVIRIDRYCEEFGSSRSRYVQMAIDHYLAFRESSPDAPPHAVIRTGDQTP